MAEKITRNKFNVACSRLIKKLGNKLLADDIRDKERSIYDDWLNCSPADKITFFTQLGNGHGMGFYEKRVLVDIFKRGYRTVLRYADKRAEEIKKEICKRSGYVRGSGANFEPRMVGIVRPLNKDRCSYE